MEIRRSEQEACRSPPELGHSGGAGFPRPAQTVTYNTEPLSTQPKAGGVAASPVACIALPPPAQGLQRVLSGLN